MLKALFGLDKEPTSFESAIFKWIFFPIMCLGLFLMFSQISQGRNQCSKLCTEKNYPDFRYTPSGRYGVQKHKCYCLTEEESNMTKAIPQGTQVF